MATRMIRSAFRVPSSSSRTEARRSARDSGEFWVARNRVQGDSLPELPVVEPPPSADRGPRTAEPSPRVADTANLDTPDRPADALQPRSLARDVAALVLGALAGLGLPAGLLVLYALS